MSINRKTILVLEDEPLIAMAMEDLILDLGLSPIVSETIQDALETI